MSTRPVVLVAVPEAHSLRAAIEDRACSALEVNVGELALACAREIRPDLIIVGDDLPDMTGIEACRLLQNDLRIRHSVPIVILASSRPSPEQRADALRAGAWDVLVYPFADEEFGHKLATYVHAKHNIDLALSDGLVDPTTGVHSRPALARRARELGALMSREHGALACVVFDFETGPGGPDAGSLVLRMTRVCDVVGVWSPTEIALLAPGTGDIGAVKLAQRVAAALGMATDAGQVAPGAALRAGYDAISNLSYSSMDPVELLMRAAAAVRSGQSDVCYPWVRRFDSSKAESRNPAVTSPRIVAREFTSQHRRVGS